MTAQHPARVEQAAEQLVLTIEILLESGFHASTPGDRSRAEWPPTAARLIGLVCDAAMRFSRANPQAMSREQAREIVLWVESQALPEIRYARIPAGQKASNPVSFTPGRYDKESKGTKKLPRQYPVTHPPTPYVYFTFRGCTRPPQGLELVLRQVDWFGTTRSRAKARLLEGLPEEAGRLACLIPAKIDDPGRIMMPGYRRGWFERSEVHYWAGRTDPDRPADVEDTPPQNACLPPIWVPYAPAVAEAQGPQPSEFRRFDIFRIVRDDGCSLPYGRYAAAVADATRGALLDLSDRMYGHGNAPTPLLANTQDVHVACLPLPQVMGPDPSNRIAGILVAVPHWPADKEQERRLDRLVQALESTKRDAKYTYGQHWKLAKVVGPTNHVAIRRSLWTRASTCWHSATPLELDRHLFHGDYRAKIAKWLRTHCVEHLGLPEVVEVDVNYNPTRPGPEPANCYPTRNMLQNHHNPGITVQIMVRFCRPVRGPLCLGRGRFFGLGLMLPVGDAWELEIGQMGE